MHLHSSSMLNDIQSMPQSIVLYHTNNIINHNFCKKFQTLQRLERRLGFCHPIHIVALLQCQAAPTSRVFLCQKKKLILLKHTIHTTVYIQLHHQMGYHLFGCSFIADVFFIHSCILTSHNTHSPIRWCCLCGCAMLQHHLTVIEFTLNILLLLFSIHWERERDRRKQKSKYENACICKCHSCLLSNFKRDKMKMQSLCAHTQTKPSMFMV